VKLILLSLVCSLAISTGIAQCPFYLSITTQEGIDSFSETYPNCTGSALFLDINGQNSNITNLNGLSQLTSIVRFGIYYSNIQDLSGLDHITDVYSGIFILGNNDLVSLNGLNSLQTVGDRLRVVLNSELLSLEGLEGLTEIGGELGIELNGQLQSLSGLNNLERVGETLKILSNPNLTSLGGLESLQEVGALAEDEFYLYNNPLIENLAGLENLQRVNGTLNLKANSGLNSIDQLLGLQAVSTEINFQSNGLLSFCAIDVICSNLENIGVELVFENNATGCSSRQEVEDSCRPLSTSEVRLQDKINVFPNPVSDVLYVQTSEGVIFEKAVLYTIMGEQLFFTSEETINFSQLSAGIYFAEVTTNHGSATKKIVKD
jgi:hypothetical protein